MATLLGIVKDMNGFFVARFFLGVAESGLFPGVVYYFSMWYGKHRGADIPHMFGFLGMGCADVTGLGTDAASGNTVYRCSSAPRL